MSEIYKYVAENVDGEEVAVFDTFREAVEYARDNGCAFVSELVYEYADSVLAWEASNDDAPRWWTACV